MDREEKIERTREEFVGTLMETFGVPREEAAKHTAWYEEQGMLVFCPGHHHILPSSGWGDEALASMSEMEIFVSDLVAYADIIDTFGQRNIARARKAPLN